MNTPARRRQIETISEDLARCDACGLALGIG